MAEKDVSSIGGTDVLYPTTSHEQDKNSLAHHSVEEVGPTAAHGVPDSHRWVFALSRADAQRPAHAPCPAHRD